MKLVFHNHKITDRWFIKQVICQEHELAEECYRQLHFNTSSHAVMMMSRTELTHGDDTLGIWYKRQHSAEYSWINELLECFFMT